MPNEKLEKDFREFSLQIDRLADEEIKAIAEKTANMKAEVSKVGESVGSSFSQREASKEKG